MENRDYSIKDLNEELLSVLVNFHHNAEPKTQHEIGELAL